MPSTLEICANLLNLLAVLLAARNNLHTWTLGILGCLLFGWLFYQSQLYADALLQVFFIITSLLGCWAWLQGASGKALPIRTTSTLELTWMVLLALAVAAGYGLLLHHFTDAYAPFVDSLVLAFSALAQILLMRRRLENWYAWLVVNSLAVPLFASRGLYLTALLYLMFWFNAWYGLWRWRVEWRQS